MRVFFWVFFLMYVSPKELSSLLSFVLVSRAAHPLVGVATLAAGGSRSVDENSVDPLFFGGILREKRHFLVGFNLNDPPNEYLVLPGFKPKKARYC